MTRTWATRMSGAWFSDEMRKKSEYAGCRRRERQARYSRMSRSLLALSVSWGAVVVVLREVTEGWECHSEASRCLGTHRGASLLLVLLAQLVSSSACSRVLVSHLLVAGRCLKRVAASE